MHQLLQTLSLALALVGAGPALARVETLLPQTSQIVSPAASTQLAQGDSNNREFGYDNFEFWSQQCLLLNGQQQYTKALEACERAIALQPRRDNVDLWTARGNILLHLGRYVDSIASYQHVVDAFPNHSFAIASQCAALYQLNRYEDAIDTCEQALSLNGNWSNVSPAFAWYYRGLAFRQLGRLETALSSFERAIAIDASNLPSLAERCETLTELEHSDQLSANCNLPAAAAVREGTPPSGIEQCGALPESDRSGQAAINLALQATVLCYEQALKDDAQNPTLWVQQGRALEQLGFYERAATAYGRAVELNPTDAIALVHQCGVLNQLQNYTDAMAACDRAFQVEGGLETWEAAYGWNQRSVALLGLQRYDEALAAANQAIEIEQRYAPAWNSRALSLWRLNQGDAAAIGQAIDQAIDRYVQARISLQETFERTYPDAPILIERGYILALFNKGRILTSFKKYEPATQVYSQALKVDDNAFNTARMNPLDSVTLSEIWANQAAAYLQLSRPQDLQVGQDQSSTQLQNPQVERARNSAQHALALNPNSFAGWYNLGLAFTNLSSPNLRCAFGAYREASRLSPGNIYALIGQGVALEKLGVVQEAIARFEQVLSIDANNALAQQQRENLMSGLWASSVVNEQTPASDPLTLQAIEIPISECLTDSVGR